MKGTISKVTRSVLPVLCLGLAAAAGSQAQSSPDYATTQKPGHSAVAFDQIDRVLLHGEAPPAVDSFASDAATIASLPPLKPKLSGPGKAVVGGIGNMLVSSVLAPSLARNGVRGSRI